MVNNLFRLILIREVLSDELADNFMFFEGTDYPSKNKPTSGGTNISSGLKARYEALIGKTKVDLLNGQSSNVLVAKVVADTYSQLTKDQDNDMTQWKLALYPRAFRSSNFMGIPQNNAGDSPSTPLEQNRGTENKMFVFYEERIESKDNDFVS